MMETLKRLWNTKEVRNNILFVLGMLVVFRLGNHIPLPGIDAQALRSLVSGNQLLGLLNIFSGGGLQNFSVFLLGIGPYITASIIIQLLTLIVPALENISKEGEAGQRKINQYMRLLTVPLAFLQSYAFLTYLVRSGPQSGQIQLAGVNLLFAMITVTAGTMFLVWLGELISERKVGNGISLIIFAGIVVSYPTYIQQTIATFTPDQLLSIIGYMVLVVLMFAGVVYLTEAQRNVPITYARQVRGNRLYGGANTHLPLRVNQAGMIPIIFALSFMLFPPLIGQYLSTSAGFVGTAASYVVRLFQNSIFYDSFYFILVVAFTYFYTAIVFHPVQIADNLQKQGAFVPGIRPGAPTAHYLGAVSNRIMLAGSLSLGIIAILPSLMRYATGVQTIVISGASLLIVVAVVIETINQIQAQIQMRDYGQL